MPAILLAAVLFFGGLSPMSVTKILPLLTKIGNPDTSFLGSVWQPWPQPELWDILKGYEEGDAYLAESFRLKRYLHGYPPPGAGEARSEIQYDTINLQRFDLTDSSLYFKWRPAVNDGDPDYYMHFRAYDDDSGSNDVSVDVEVFGESGAGGSPELTLQTPPTPPWTPTGEAGAQADEVAWDPSGTYLAVGGWNEAYDEFFAWYSWDGSSLTKLTNPSTMPDGAVAAAAWDSTGTYLALGQEWNGGWYALLLYKRTGNTLARVQYEYDPPYTSVMHLQWAGSYLFVGGDYQDTDYPLTVWERSGDSLSLVQSLGPKGQTHGFALHPDGDVLAVSWDAFTGADDKRVYVYSWDGAGTLTQIGTYVYSAGGEYRRPSWDATGTYLAVALEADTNGVGADWYSWNGSVLTKLTTPNLADIEFTGWEAEWHPTEAVLAVVGVVSGAPATDREVRLFSRSGTTLTWEMDTEEPSDPTVAYAGAWHPDGDVFAVAHQDGNYLTLYAYSGGAAGPYMKITIDEATPIIVSPYAPDTHAWLRVRHISAGNRVLVDTALEGCGTWTNRADEALSSGATVEKVGIMMNSWVDTHAEDDGPPTPGFFGPFNPSPEEFVLYLLTAIQPLPPEYGSVRVVLPLLTRIL